MMSFSSSGHRERGSLGGGRQSIVAALDVGTSKITCFIARIDSNAQNAVEAISIQGIGHQVSKGLRSGAIVDMEAAEEAIRAAVDAAERMAGFNIHEVLINLSCGQPGSQTIGMEMTLPGHEVGEQDVSRLLREVRQRCHDHERTVVHAIPVAYMIDGNRGIRDPRGMYGDRLGVEMHVVDAATGPLRNLAVCIERCHLDITGFIASPYASGLACLVEDEMELGATCIDMGGGVTSIAVFCEGNLVYNTAVPLGGHHVTNDIARGLSTPLTHAERMKTLYGSALAGPSDEREMIDVPQIGEDDSDFANRMPRSILTGIIQPRLEETLEHVREHLQTSGLDKSVIRRVVLAGGASQMTGVRELASRILGLPVRLGRPSAMKGLAEATGGPAFATCAGLLAYAYRKPPEVLSNSLMDQESAGPRSQFARIGRWLKENF